MLLHAPLSCFESYLYDTCLFLHNSNYIISCFFIVGHLSWVGLIQSTTNVITNVKNEGIYIVYSQLQSRYMYCVQSLFY
jgi:hypothetical protein